MAKKKNNMLNQGDAGSVSGGRSKCFSLLGVLTSNRNFILEAAVAMSLVATAILVGILSYSILSAQEVARYEAEYNLIVDEALAATDRSLNRASEGNKLMASMYSNLFPDAARWPNVTISPYREITSHLNEITGFIFTSFQPLVNPAQARAFEHFAYDTIESNSIYPPGTGVSSFGKGIFKFDPNSDAPDKRVHDISGDTSWGGKYKILAPIMNVNTGNSFLSNLYLMSNGYADRANGHAADNLITCAAERADLQDNSIECGSVSEIFDYDGDGFEGFHPTASILHPIYPANNQTTLVGIAYVAVAWSTLLNDVVPDRASKLLAVLHSNDDSYSYTIDKGKVQFVGIGDSHDSNLSKYAKIRSIFSSGSTAASTVKYTVTFYPSEEFFDSYRTALPIQATIAGQIIIFITSAIFGLFAYFTRVDLSEKAVEMDEKRIFVRFISHEVRTPLNAAVMGLQLMETQLTTLMKTLHDKSKSIMEQIAVVNIVVPECESLLKDIYSGTDTAALVLDDLLYYDNVRGQMQNAETQPIPAWSLLRIELNSFKGRAQQCGVDLQIHLERWSPMLMESKKQRIRHLFFQGDRGRISQVLKVLLSNALKYSPEKSCVLVNVEWLETAPLPSQGPLNNIEAWNARKRRSIVDLLQENIESGYIRISVQDSGNGISADELAKIENDGIRFKLENLNVGESIALNQEVAAEIVKKHNGRMSVKSEGLGKGSTFVVELPVFLKPTHLAQNISDSSSKPTSSDSYEDGPRLSKRRSSVFTLGSYLGRTMRVRGEMGTVREADLESGGRGDGGGGGGGVLRPSNEDISHHRTPIHPLSSSSDHRVLHLPSLSEIKRALVVDDVATNRKMLMRLLKIQGFECQEAKDGQEAMDIFFSQSFPERFQLICMDFEMPVMNGPTATMLLRKGGCQSLIVGVTGNVLQKDIKHFLSQGANAVLPKPLKMEDLMSIWERRHEFLRQLWRVEDMGEQEADKGEGLHLREYRKDKEDKEAKKMIISQQKKLPLTTRKFRSSKVVPLSPDKTNPVSAGESRYLDVLARQEEVEGGGGRTDVDEEAEIPPCENSSHTLLSKDATPSDPSDIEWCRTEA